MNTDPAFRNDSVSDAIWAACPGIEGIGRLRAKRSSDIKASRFSVGFETLDRRLFDPAPAYPRLAELGVKWARLHTGWSRCEREKGADDFSWLDSVVDTLLGIGIQPFFDICYGNKLYTPEAPHANAVGWVPIYREEARAGWLRFVGALVDHFKDRITHYEIWNEPDFQFFWQPQGPNPEEYTELVRMTAAQIRGRQPGAAIIGGALAHGAKPIGLIFLERCLAAGLAQQIDAYSFHPYRVTPEAYYEGGIRAMRSLLDAQKPGIPLWQGEGGCPSRGDGFGALSQFPWDETRQAKWLLRQVGNDLANDIALSSYFHACDLKNFAGRAAQDKPYAYYGLLRAETYAPKPAFFAYQCVCSLFDAETRREDGILLTADIARTDAAALERYPVEGQPEYQAQIRSVGFSRNGRPLVAYWYPSNLLQPFPPRKIRMVLWHSKQLRLERPVLLDPLTQRVYRCRPEPAGDSEYRYQRGASVLTLPDVPLMEYPLIVTDAAALE